MDGAGVIPSVHADRALRILLSAQGLKRERSAAAAETRAATADALVPDGRTKPRKKSKLAAAVTAAVE